MPDYEQLLFDKIIAADYPEPEREHRFDKVRKWRFDFAYPERKIAIEVEGGSFSAPVRCHICGNIVKHRLKSGVLVPVRAGGRHNRGANFEKDAEKYNQAALDGWMVLRVTPAMIKDGRAVNIVRDALIQRDTEWLEY